MIRRYFLLLPLLLSLIGILSFRVGQINMTMDRLVALASVPVVVILLSIKVRRFDLRFGLIALALTLITLTNDGPINGLFAYIAPMVFSLIVARTVITRKDYESALKNIALIFFAGSILAYLAGPSSFPVFFDEAGRFRFFFFEPNIYGAASAYILVLCLPLAIKRNIKMALFSLGILCVIIAFSKGPVIALVVGLTYYSLRVSKSKKGVYIVSIAGAVTLMLITVFDQLSTDLFSRFLREDALNSRTATLLSAWNDFQRAPILGQGGLSFRANDVGLLTQLGSDELRNLWIWQYQLAYLHDFGIVGWALVQIILIYPLLRQKSKERIRNSTIAGFFVIYAASQFTTTHLSSIFWIAYGLCGITLVTQKLVRKASIAE